MSQFTFKSVMGNQQSLDGGAMFGNVPKALWSTWMPADEENRVTLATRALLVIEPQRKILFETGIGAYMSPKLKQRFGVFETDHVLLKSLAAHGIATEDIDIVVLSHLHFDHAGGLLTAYEEGQKPGLLFPRAHLVMSEQAFERAVHPHPRDRASFIPELMDLLQAHRHRIHLVNHSQCDLLGDAYRFHYSDGHTPGLLITEIKDGARTVFFVSDLIPGKAWIHTPVSMGYDRAAELLIDEKKALLDHVLTVDGELFLTHDPTHDFVAIQRDEKGKYSAKISQGITCV